MDELWSRVKELEGRTLQTLSRRLPVHITRVEHDQVLVTPESTGTTRAIRREEIEKAYELRLSTEELTPSRLRAEGASEFNPAYVAAILNALKPGH